MIVQRMIEFGSVQIALPDREEKDVLESPTLERDVESLLTDSLEDIVWSVGLL